MCCFLIWLDEEDADIVEEEDVDTWLLAVECPIMFFISAIEFCISPRPCLMAAAELDELEEDCFEEEEEEDKDDEAVRDEDMRRCVEDVLAIRDVVDVELVEDTLLLELVLLLRSSCAAELVIAVDAVPAEASDDEDDAFDDPNRPRVGGVGGPIIVPPGLPVSAARSDISRRGNRNCDRRVATDGPDRLMTISLMLLVGVVEVAGT